MTTHKEPLKLALEALKKSDGFLYNWHENYSDDEADAYAAARQLNEQAIIAAEKALAQPEQDCTRSHPHEEMSKECELRTEIARLTNELARLKAKPKEPEQEPAWYHAECDDPDHSGFFKEAIDAVTQVNEHGGFVAQLYTTPPQRTWEGLSVFETNDLVENTEYEDYRDLVERTEAKLKEKNT